jgi:hypothetical protein
MDVSRRDFSLHSAGALLAVSVGNAAAAGSAAFDPNFKFGPQRHLVSVGPQQVNLVTDGKPVKAVRLLRAGTQIPFRQDGTVVEFTVPDLHQYEVAALEL